ncbi:MAG: enoyl-CoA hydratase/isomerase family protein [Crocinitomicaceae bacterium]|nr:enoyl-CoA hydratase/isomerase family protein [Crocinitomicaceae bacterium]MDP4724426.1 enoyl-CoA hydratase/isomerase family protein [Crocinitomicaceae bacterium]MDP4740217.1 enoyl-CoA hydratase/isomerase family protein [Crocinitomicaceae bacterium]MDP4799277.1 enoyl-CoA hydratase/isomerase family protein [Crocinitomicaceae bacterium]MDP4806494.1 enoyl-CoA hydratase/isomerase family protein [Crocinitomicaceae bacterium]
MDHSHENGFVLAEITTNGIGLITFGHPMSNSLPGHILQTLADTITEVAADERTKVLVLQSQGSKAFCAGASFDELISIQDLETGLAFFSGFAKVINACRKAPKLIIGRVQGKAVGGGVGLASATDYCFATTKADVKLSELAVGIGPFVVGPAVERKIGLSAMSELAINATEWRSAQWAKEKGLYTEIFEDEASLDAAIQSLSERLANSNPEAMQELKQIFWQGTENWDKLLLERAAISGRLVLSEFTRAAISAFKAK